MAGLAIVLTVGLVLFTTLPASQRWLAAKVADVLSEELETEVSIGRAQIGLFNRVVLDDVLILDQESDTLLAATRLSVKMSLPALAENKVRISSAQLFGFDIQLRRATPETPYNFQFLVDYFASEDTTSTPLDLALSQVIIRRGRLSYDVLSEQSEKRFSTSHLSIENLQCRLSVDRLTNTHIESSINKLKFTESRSGLSVKDLQTDVSADFPEGEAITACMSNFHLLLPESEVQIPRLEVALSHPQGADSSVVRLNNANLELFCSLTPADLSPILPALASFEDVVKLRTIGTLEDGSLDLKDLNMQTKGLTLDAHTSLALFVPETPFNISAEIHQLELEQSLSRSILSILTEYGIMERPLAGTLLRLGNVSMKGNGSYSKAQAQGNFSVGTGIGNVIVQGHIAHEDIFQGNITTDGIRLIKLLTNPDKLPVDEINLAVQFKGSLRHKSLKSELSGDFVYGNEKLDHIQADIDFSPTAIKSHLLLTDDHYNINLQGNLTSSVPLLQGAKALNSLQGNIQVQDLSIHDGQRDYELSSLEVAVNNGKDKLQHLLIEGDFINAELSGNFSYLTLGQSLQQLVHKAFPSLLAAPSNPNLTSKDHVDFKCYLWDTDALFAMAGIDLQLPESAYLEGSVDGEAEIIDLKCDLPHIIYSGQDFRAMSLIAKENGDSLDLYLSTQRMMEDGPLDVSVIAHGSDDLLTSLVRWDDHNIPVQRGELSADTRFHREGNQQLAVDISLLPTEIIVADTTWNVHPANIQYAEGTLSVNDFQVSQIGRHLKVHGRVSSASSDTLFADLRNVDLQYVFGIIDFHDVEFEGLATGKVKVSNFSDIPRVDGLLTVNNFKLNEGALGRLSLDIGFGRKDDRAIDIDGLIRDQQNGRMSHVVGIVKPGLEPDRGLDLNIFADRINTYFINFFTSSIFERLEGRATGYAHLYGPFGYLDLEGDLQIDTMDVGIPVLGTRYHLMGGDSIHLRPGGIQLTDIHVYDALHGSDSRRHEGILNGSLRFEHFDNLRYDFHIEAHDLLGYDFHNFGDGTFYGTAIADGHVNLHGRPGELNVDIQCTPAAGTVFTYNVSTPETTTDAEFIRFTSSQTLTEELSAVVSQEQSLSEEVQEDNDMRINFDLIITPEAQMRLLMDSRSEDYITLWGNGHIRASYYNKGRFQMYGTYHVDHGNYRLTLQDFIRKDFQFESGSSIVFGGNPMQGDLNLHAIYTVPSVNLNDLAVGSNFSNSSVRVNCLMNIGGRAEHPQISFDFDIPNVNEDEKRMVRSLISTDEERNLQVIYLLGIGRFYTQDLGGNVNQTNTAMQSLLSSTLSGQLNDVLSNAIGSKDWNFGTNFSTGQLGWQDMDVEGSVSGRLLNNRLLVNGTFGYRDTPVANTNFIGDFDVRWLVNKSGSVSLKAYSETNDRYFTKSALTTQGIGIQLQKDFTNLRELFQRRK